MSRRPGKFKVFLRERRFLQGPVYRDPIIDAIPPITRSDLSPSHWVMQLLWYLLHSCDKTYLKGQFPDDTMNKDKS